MVHLKMISVLLLAIFLTVSNTACGKKEPPKAPEVPLFQTIVDQEFCENGSCKTQSFCAEWRIDPDSDQWVQVAEHELKKCHGKIGVDSKGIVEIKNYLREVKDWAKRTCK